jgi:hypothetical protein
MTPSLFRGSHLRMNQINRETELSMTNRYGTTADMIIQTIDDHGIAKLIAIDKDGLYLTTRDRVDRNIADVNRYGVPREVTNHRLTEMGLDPRQMFNDNRHLIKTETDPNAGAKILNPIKASKRRG